MNDKHGTMNDGARMTRQLTTILRKVLRNDAQLLEEVKPPAAAPPVPHPRRSA